MKIDIIVYNYWRVGCKCAGAEWGDSESEVSFPWAVLGCASTFSWFVIQWRSVGRRWARRIETEDRRPGQEFDPTAQPAGTGPAPRRALLADQGKPSCVLRTVREGNWGRVIAADRWFGSGQAAARYHTGSLCTSLLTVSYLYTKSHNWVLSYYPTMPSIGRDTKFTVCHFFHCCLCHCIYYAYSVRRWLF